jgi:hypothetical protein
MGENGETLFGLNGFGMMLASPIEGEFGVSGAVKLLLVLTLLPAHAPVCKVAAVEACTHPTSAPVPQNCPVPPCCAKCSKQFADSSVPSAPKRDNPVKLPCRTNCLSPLCTVFSAVVSDTFVSGELDQPTAERLPIAFQMLSPDGFHTLLDRPPRA